MPETPFNLASPQPEKSSSSGEARSFAAPRNLLRMLDAVPLPFGLPGRFVLALLPILLGVLWIVLQVGGGSYQRLTPEASSVQVDSTLTLTLRGQAPAQYQVTITPQSELSDPTSGGERSMAAQTVPPYLKPVSPLYALRGKGAAFDLVFSAERESASLPDLYRWDAAAGVWTFVPTSFDAQTGQMVGPATDGAFALFQTEGTSPLLGTVLEPGQTLEGSAAGALNVLFVSGVTATEDGELESTQIALQSNAPANVAAMPMVEVSDPGILNAILNNHPVRQRFIEGLSTLADQQHFSGAALDFGPLADDQADAFSTLVEAAAQRLHESGKSLAVRVANPVEGDSIWETGGYDWQRLGPAADLLVVGLPGNPGEMRAGGQADRFLVWAAGQVSRTRLLVEVSTLSLNEWGSQITPISYDYALEPLGRVRQIAEGDPSSFTPVPGQELSFRLDGDAVDFQGSEAATTPHFDVYSGDGVHTIWLTTGAALRGQLDWISSYRPAGVVLANLLADGNTASIPSAVEQFRADQPSTEYPALQIHWVVADDSGAVIIDTAAGIGTPMVWTPLDAGDYVVKAEVMGDQTSDRGAAAVLVGGTKLGVVPSQEGVVLAGAPNIADARPTPSAAIPEGMPPPVYPAGAIGNFELGGQVNHVINDPDRMHESGMTWVKFQLAWAEDMDSSVAWDLIQQGREHNFKVLLSIPGRENYPTSINVPKYLEFLRGVAYYGPDAIEVWNEGNIDYEWPRGQISGTAYVRDLLAPAYNAIKEVNPNIMVISGALAPTGAFFGDGGCSAQGTGCDDWLYLQQMAEAGAANYMDCVGTHYNAGATAPSATTGHPADPGYQHYSWYYGGMLQLYGGTFGRPVCFTELGYLSGEGLGSVPGRFGWASGTSVAQQAQWLAEAAQLSKQSGIVRLMIVWNFDFTYWGDDPMAGYAMVRPNGSCPACDALDLVMP